MNKDGFLQTVLEQIRCKKARTFVSEELENHIDDQANSYMDCGLSQDEAVERAVIDMGDPVGIGNSLDQIHRPKVPWKMLILIGVISVLSLFIQFLFYRNNIAQDINIFYNQLGFMLIGISAMMIIFFIDYSILARYAKEIGGIFCVLLIACITVLGREVNGAINYIHIFGQFSISLGMLSYLYVPIYGAILYQYRGGGYREYIKSLIWIVIPIIIIGLRSYDGLTIKLLLLLVMMLSIGIAKKWFQVKKAKLLMLYTWGGTLIALSLFLLENGKKFISFYFLSEVERNQYGYPNFSEMLSINAITGKEGILFQDYLSFIKSDYIIAYLISAYGLIGGILFLVLISVFVYGIFKIALTQKNQLGMIVGCACGLVYLAQIFPYVLHNIGLWPGSMMMSLPFFSYGGSGIFVSYSLLGLLLSIYRYQNIIPNKQFKGKKIRIQFIES